jgi:hypothetical protein
VTSAYQDVTLPAGKKLVDTLFDPDESIEWIRGQITARHPDFRVSSLISMILAVVGMLARPATGGPY